jgi:hypothetical protein
MSCYIRVAVRDYSREIDLDLSASPEESLANPLGPRGAVGKEFHFSNRHADCLGYNGGR